MLKSSQPRDPDERQVFNQHQLAAREAARRINQLDDAASLLYPAMRAARLAGLDVDRLEALMQSIEQQRTAVESRHPGHIVPRSRPQVQKQWHKEGPRHRYRLFIDESGGSRLNLTVSSRFFAIGGLLISEPAHEAFEERWTAWKREWIGNERATMHAKQLGRKSIRYYANKKGPSEDALASLDELIDGVDCSLFVMAIDKRGYQEQYLREKVNEILPGSHYDMCLNFLLERVVYCLLQSDDAHAHVYAESRNRIEDARLQMEYQRLQVEGTSFQADTWFRYQLGPHITFQSKDDNVAGLQLVDVLLKAAVERLDAPSSEPLRWPVTKRKLYAKREGRVAGWGCKIFPGNEALVEAVLGERTEKNGGSPVERPPPIVRSSTISMSSIDGPDQSVKVAQAELRFNLVSHVHGEDAPGGRGSRLYGERTIPEGRHDSGCRRVD